MHNEGSILFSITYDKWRYHNEKYETNNDMISKIIITPKNNWAS